MAGYTYNRRRYYTPSMSSQLRDSRDAHGKTQEKLASITKERDFLRAVAEHMMTEWLLNNGWDKKDITRDAVDRQLVAVYESLEKDND